MKKQKKLRTNIFTTQSESIFYVGMISLLLTLLTGLWAYYTYSHFLREMALAMTIITLFILYTSMFFSINKGMNHRFISFVTIVFILILYFLQRMVLHRYDFSVGDPSDYFLAGVCSVVYNQDIGYFMPLTATISAIGYNIFGVEFAPFMDVILYASIIPIGYMIFHQFTKSIFLSILLSLFLMSSPLSIWFDKSSFSEPLWQLLLLLFFYNTYIIMQEASLKWKNIFILYLILFLVPFVRGEGVLYFGLVLFLALYHLWKFQQFKSMVWISLGLLVLVGSIHLTVGIRAHYLLSYQYSRLIPHITAVELMTILYGAVIATWIFLGILYLLRKKYAQWNLPLILVGLSIVLKVGIAYFFATRKHQVFTELLFSNEYGLMVGNFGIPLTLLLILGMLLLYYTAIKGNRLSLIAIALYTIFDISFVMQGVKFTDVHAMFLYWNRYYFSVFMMVHLFGLALLMKYVYIELGKYIKEVRYQRLLFALISIMLVSLSMNTKMYKIVTTEAHQVGAYKFYEWVKEKVGREPVGFLMDSSVIYKQNKEHIGLNDIKYLVSRAFSIYKINVKNYQRVQPHKLKKGVKFNVPLSKVHYVMTLGTKDYKLDDIRLTKIDEFELPLSWRQHFGLDKNASSIHHGDVTKSVVMHLPFHAVLYRVNKVLKNGKPIQFNKRNHLSAQILGKGWDFINNHTSAFSSEGKGTIYLPKLQAGEGKGLIVTLRYAVINAGQDNVKHLQFSLNGTVLKEEDVSSHTTREVTLKIPKHLLADSNNQALTMEVTNQGQIMLRSITIDKKGV